MPTMRAPAGERGQHLGLVVRLDECAHAQLVRDGEQRAQVGVVEEAHDQEDGVRTRRARPDDLIRVDHEVLGDHRQRHPVAHARDVVERRAEARGVGDDADGRRAVTRVQGREVE